MWSLADLDLFVVVACTEHCFDVGAKLGQWMHHDLPVCSPYTVSEKVNVNRMHQMSVQYWVQRQIVACTGAWQV